MCSGGRLANRGFCGVVLSMNRSFNSGMSWAFVQVTKSSVQIRVLAVIRFVRSSSSVIGPKEFCPSE